MVVGPIASSRSLCDGVSWSSDSRRCSRLPEKLRSCFAARRAQRPGAQDPSRVQEHAIMARASVGSVLPTRMTRTAALQGDEPRGRSEFHLAEPDQAIGGAGRRRQALAHRQVWHELGQPFVVCQHLPHLLRRRLYRDARHRPPAGHSPALCRPRCMLLNLSGGGKPLLLAAPTTTTLCVCPVQTRVRGLWDG